MKILHKCTCRSVYTGAFACKCKCICAFVHMWVFCPLHTCIFIVVACKHLHVCHRCTPFSNWVTALAYIGYLFHFCNSHLQKKSMQQKLQICLASVHTVFFPQRWSLVGYKTKCKNSLLLPALLSAFQLHVSAKVKKSHSLTLLERTWWTAAVVFKVSTYDTALWH